jgi:hypothetical protein
MPAAVHLVLRDADPSGIVIATRDNWTGKAFGLPVGDLQHLTPALSGAGVYVLIGYETSQDTSMPVLYVGEAEDIPTRLKPGHQQLGRDDIQWQRVVVFASQSDDLHKAHVRWLEAELVRLAKLASRWRLMNSTAPAAPKLPEFDEVFVRSFLANMLVLYPLLGVDAFAGTPGGGVRVEVETAGVEPAAGVADDTPTHRHPAVGAEVALATATITGLARAVIGADMGLTLLKGSRFAAIGQASESAKVRKIRELLVENGNAVARDDDWWELTTDHGPLAPSTAAELVLGYAVNGRQAWKSSGGRTYHQLVTEDP